MKSLYWLVEQKFGLDKVTHFFAVALVGVVASLLFAKFDAGDSSWVYALEGFGVAVVVAVLKEVVDFMCNRSFDIGDIRFGVYGAALSLLIVGLLV